MDLLATIEQDVTQAAKAKDNAALLALRGIKSTLHNAAIAKRPAELGEEDALKVLRSEVKKRREAAELYTKGGRAELAEKEQVEVALIEKYLPAAVDESVVRQKVKEVIASTSASGPQAMGKVMGAVMAQFKGQSVDGSVVSKIVKEELSSQSSA